MNVSREDKIKEAVARMKKMGIFSQTIEQFEKEGYISISEPPFGAYYWAEGEDLDRIHKFEQEHNAVVFMVIRSYTNFGKLDSMLFVSDYPEEWEDDNELLKENSALAYVYNHDDPWCSEMGSIGYRLTIAAGLARTW